jgi:hypothetical protein
LQDKQCSLGKAPAIFGRGTDFCCCFGQTSGRCSFVEGAPIAYLYMYIDHRFSKKGPDHTHLPTHLELVVPRFRRKTRAGKGMPSGREKSLFGFKPR